ncbi:MAG: acyl-ACP desaturase, partial [Actinobacteria bacterium]|nr:acyl-ACP desaturase [Actinomycetota bacterium]
MTPAELLAVLEPTAAKLYDRHMGVAKEWFPHEYVPWSRGRDFDPER